MKVKITKKSVMLITAILLSLFIIISLLGIFYFRQKDVLNENEQNRLQSDLLDELDARKGDYNENVIVLFDTSHSRAENLAKAIGADLRITRDGSFATLTLNDGRTIVDVVAEEENKQYLDFFGIDFKADPADLGLENAGETLPSLPTSGYIQDSEMGSHLGYMGLSSAWDCNKGAGVAVAVIDTGIDVDHPEFVGRISEYSYNASEDKIVKDYIIENGQYDWSIIDDEQGHGTGVAAALGAAMDGKGTVGVAPEVSFIVIKAECDEQGRFKSTADLVFGLYYAIERDVRVINMSFGSGSNPFEKALQLAVDSDIICVAAAGNDSSPIPTYPAADENAIGVGALTRLSSSTIAKMTKNETVSTDVLVKICAVFKYA